MHDVDYGCISAKIKKTKKLLRKGDQNMLQIAEAFWNTFPAGS